MYFTVDYILEAIQRLGSVHPFFGITFLSCKENHLPVGRQETFPMDHYTKSFMDRVHRIDSQSRFYYQPFYSNARIRHWVSDRYPSSGLQAINTQTFGQVFLHTRNQKSWGWNANYVDVLATFLRDSNPISMLDLAVWVYKDKDWPQFTDLNQVSQHFLSSFDITVDERTKLFSENAGYRSADDAFQPNPVTWEELCSRVPPPPDAGPSRGATLSYLELSNVGPASEICMEPSSRLNIITGDNGLGKSFLMECAWWALTGTWASYPAQPHSVTANPKSTLTYELASGKNQPSRKTVVYDAKQGVWLRDKTAPSIPGLIVYARVDGSYAVWDPIKQYRASEDPRSFVFSRDEVWDGIPGSIEGIVRDWVRWQTAPVGSPFEVFRSVLRTMSPPDMGELQPGKPVRMINDARDIPTIVMPYGEVPLVNASAGVRRIVTLAYLIVWAWHEHTVEAELTGMQPENRMVIMIDEIEAHLHPQWQRVILPALLGIESILSKGLQIQFIISTHSPLVLASAETRFSLETDTLFHLAPDRVTGEAELSLLDFIRYGDVNAWLTSPVFSLGQARSQDAERAIDMAKLLQLDASPSKTDVEAAHSRLLDVLSETDPFWPRWIAFAEHHGVKV